MISLVIPTFGEAEVIESTLRRSATALRGTGEDFEIIVVDDSAGDGTAERAERLSSELPVRVLRREGRQGLASAVMAGWRMARGDVLGVMDADLQHPPEVLAALVQALRDPQIDIAIASRHVPGGSRRWSLARRAISWLTAHLAACVLPWTLARVNDPMSGMFMARSRTLKGVELRPLGYKILLEVLGRGRWHGLIEIPYAFTPRRQGTSKLGARQSVEYLLHLGRLARATGQFQTWIFYGVVALGGAVIDASAFWLLVHNAAWKPWAAMPAAIELALLSNFFWNQAITFRKSSSSPALSARGLLRTLLRYERVCLAGAALNFIATVLLLARGVGLVPAAVLGVTAGGTWNMLFNVPRIWQAWSDRPAPETASPRATHDAKLAQDRLPET